MRQVQLAVEGLDEGTSACRQPPIRRGVLCAKQTAALHSAATVTKARIDLVMERLRRAKNKNTTLGRKP